MTAVEDRLPVGLLTASLIAVACASAMVASFQYVVVDMQTALGFSSDSANALTFMPMAASLLVVFVAGVLVDRWGPRPVQMCAAGLFTAGAVLVAVAPGMGVAVFGRMLDGVGGVTMTIVGVAVINTSVTEPRLRARVFGFYAAVTPVVFIVVPPITALLVEYSGWRAGMIPGITLGLLALLTTARSIPASRVRAVRSEPGRQAPELVTPLLAGMVLAGIGLGVTTVSVSAGLSLAVLLIALVGLVLLIVVMRAIARPTLNMGWCRERGMLLLLGAMVLAAMPNLFFFTNLLLQYRYGAPLILIALLLTTTQVAAVGGSLLSGPVSARFGPARTAVAGLLICGVLRLATMFVTTDSPIWVPVLGLAASAAPAAFVIGPMINTLLSRAPADDSGIGSSVNKATWTLGGVLGGAFIGAATYNAFQARLTDILSTDGLPFREAEVIAREIRDGAAVANIAGTITEPIARDDIVAHGPGLVAAQVHAFTVMGLVSGAITLGAALLMLLFIRRAAVTAGSGIVGQFKA